MVFSSYRLGPRFGGGFVVFGFLRYNLNMNVFDAYLQDKPSVFYKFDHTGTSFPNQMGDSRALTAPASLSKATNTPIVTGSVGPVLVGSGMALQVPIDRLTPTSKKSPVTLECWALPLANNVGIMSHDGVDGITFDGEKLSFAVELSTLGTVSANWYTPDYLTRYHIAGVFDGKKVSLYVNGELKDEVDLSQEQLNDDFKVPSNSNFLIGQSAQVNSLLVDAIAIYEHALSSDSILRHYVAGSAARDALDNVMSFGGLIWTFDDFDRNIAIANDVALDSGLFTSTTYRDGVRPAIAEDGLSESGTWMTNIPVSVTELTSLSGVKVSWEGDGYFDVQASFDLGITWSSPLENGQLIPGTVGLNALNTTIDIRVSFDGGLPDDISVIRQLSYVVYPDSVIISDNSSRTVTLGGTIATATRSSELIESYANAGLRMAAAQTATIDPDTSDDPIDTQTVEIWFKLNSISDGVIIDGLSISGGAFTVSGTGYFNGSTIKPAPVVNQWIHAVIVSAAPSNTAITIGGGPSMSVGMVAIYRSPLASDQVSRLYASYFGKPFIQLNEASTISVHESTEMYNLYDYDWQIVSGGR